MMRIAADQDPDYVAKRAKCDQEGSEDVVHQRLIRTPQDQWIVPRNSVLRTFVLSEAHDSVTSGHGGEERTLQRLRERWHWEGDRKDVAEYITTCVWCQKAKVPRRRMQGPLFPIVATKPGQVVTMDFVSKFAPAKGTGHWQCLVMIDKFSRFVFLEGCSMEVSAEATAKIFFKRVVPLVGVPRKVISDRGP